MRCPHCPVPAGEPCLSTRLPVFCEWAASGDENRRAHVVARSSIGPGRPTPPSPEPPPRPPPSPWEQAKHLASAVASAVASGGKQVTPEQKARRLTICRGCEHFDADAERCRVCTCFMQWKTRLEAWHCPLDPPKW
jgi:hypothetical protein